MDASRRCTLTLVGSGIALDGFRIGMGCHRGAGRGRRRDRLRRDPESRAACAAGGRTAIFGAMNLLAHR
jgi:hypothetical protein